MQYTLFKESESSLKAVSHGVPEDSVTLFRISGHKINTCRNVKYLGVTLEKNLDWNRHLDSLNLKLNEAIVIFRKIRHYVPKVLWKTLYETIFQSHLTYACQIWVQNINALNKIQALQDEALRILNFRANDYDVGELYKNNKIIRISDYIKLPNCFFVRDVLTNSSIPPFQNYFIKSENLHQYNPRLAIQNSDRLTQWNTDFYGIKSIQPAAKT